MIEPITGMDYVSMGDSSADVTVNELLAVAIALGRGKVVDRTLTAPPGSPAEGDIYIPASTATGDWTGKEGNLAIRLVASWVFVTPTDGMKIWDDANTRFEIYDGGSWRTVDAIGTATLSAGTVTVTLATCRTTSNIQVTRKSNAGTIGHLTANPGSGTFVISSTSNTETSVIQYRVTG